LPPLPRATIRKERRVSFEIPLQKQFVLLQKQFDADV
jgi:hypothetical protein